MFLINRSKQLHDTTRKKVFCWAVSCVYTTSFTCWSNDLVIVMSYSGPWLLPLNQQPLVGYSQPAHVLLSVVVSSWCGLMSFFRRSRLFDPFILLDGSLLWISAAFKPQPQNTDHGTLFFCVENWQWLSHVSFATARSEEMKHLRCKCHRPRPWCHLLTSAGNRTEN